MRKGTGLEDEERGVWKMSRSEKPLIAVLYGVGDGSREKGSFGDGEAEGARTELGKLRGDSSPLSL